MRVPTFSQFQHHASLISQQFDSLNVLFEQSNSGRKLIASSDDPVLANQIKLKENIISALSNYENNGTIAKNRSSLFLSTMQNAISIQTDIQSQIVKAQSGTLTDANRASIAEQLKGDLSRLLALANTQDGTNYIYSGFNTTSAPFILSGSRYSYQGDYNQSRLDIGPSTSATLYENGFSVFGDVFTGNGIFTISANSTNTGTAFTTPGSVVDSSAYVADNYTLKFVENSAGKLAYQIIGATSGQVVPPLPAVIPDDAPEYIADTDIKFNGISFHVTGAPAEGDTFTIAPSTQENVFNVLQDLITTLQSPVTNQAVFNQKLSQFSVNFSKISQHFIEYQSQMGTEGAQIENEITNNKNTISQNQIALKDLAEVTPEQIYTAIMQKSLALQAAQESYKKLQDTLLELLKL